MQKKYLLDTNICISLLKSRYGIREEIINRGFHNCFISEITIAELYYGASKSKNKEQTVKDVDFVSEKFTILPIFPALELFADFKARLEKEGTRIDDFDLLIGATAVFNDLIMVSDNVKHLGRIPNITIENWTEGKKSFSD